jgi:excisionase family DNA binding protein
MSSKLGDDADQWISQAEAARIRGVSRQAIALLLKRQRLQTLKIGGRLLVRRSDVEQFIAQSPGRRPKRKGK